MNPAPTNNNDVSTGMPEQIVDEFGDDNGRAEQERDRTFRGLEDLQDADDRIVREHQEHR